MPEKEQETEPEEDFTPSEEYEELAVASLKTADEADVAQVYATLALAATLRESTLVISDILEAALFDQDADGQDDPDGQ